MRVAPETWLLFILQTNNPGTLCNCMATLNNACFGKYLFDAKT